MRILVTGSDGYIGNPLAMMLAGRGHDVTGWDAGFYRDGWLYGNRAEAFPSVHMDVRDAELEDLYGFDAVVHLAELSNDPLGQLNLETTYEINHRGSVEFAAKCKQAGIERFIYSSSCSVYGVGNSDVKTEESETNPQTAYASCKVLVERDVALLADERFSPTFLRNATAFGASPRMRFDIVLNNLAGLAWTTGEIRMTSDGTPWRPLVHILDIGEAVACALSAPRNLVHSEIFNVGNSQANYQVRDIAEIVAETFPGCKLTFGARDGDNRSYRVSFEKINSRLPGFQCGWDAARGARELRGIFEQIQMTAETFAFRGFTRLKQITHLLASGQLDAHLCWRQAACRN